MVGLKVTVIDETYFTVFWLSLYIPLSIFILFPELDASMPDSK